MDMGLPLVEMATAFLDWLGIYTVEFWKGVLIMFFLALKWVKLRDNAWWIMIIIGAMIFLTWIGFFNIEAGINAAAAAGEAAGGTP